MTELLWRYFSSLSLLRAYSMSRNRNYSYGILWAAGQQRFYRLSAAVCQSCVRLVSEGHIGTYCHKPGRRERSTDDDYFCYQAHINDFLPGYEDIVKPPLQGVYGKLKEVIRSQAVTDNKAALSRKTRSALRYNLSRRSSKPFLSRTVRDIWWYEISGFSEGRKTPDKDSGTTIYEIDSKDLFARGTGATRRLETTVDVKSVLPRPTPLGCRRCPVCKNLSNLLRVKFPGVLIMTPNQLPCYHIV